VIGIVFWLHYLGSVSEKPGSWVTCILTFFLLTGMPLTSPVHPAALSWPLSSSAGGARSPVIATAATAVSPIALDTQSLAGSGSVLSPLAPLFVPQHCSADNDSVVCLSS